MVWALKTIEARWQADGPGAMQQGMKLLTGMLAAALSASGVSPAQAERCMAASMAANGEPQYTQVVVDLDSETRLNPADLPERTVAVMCLRPSIVPMPNDVRVLSEWRVAFGIAEQGARALWISAEAGRIQIRVDDGELNARERAALDEWLVPANVRLLLEWQRR